MAIGDTYTEDEINTELDKLLPTVNKGRGDKPLSREGVKAILMAENMGGSGGVAYANRVSPRGAMGVAQVMPATIQGLKAKGYLPADYKEDLADASLGEQLAVGLSAMSEMANTLGSVDPKYIAAYYNGGTKGRLAYKTNSPDAMPAETTAYLGKIDQALQMQKSGYVPPTGRTVKPAQAFLTSPLKQAETAYQSWTAAMPEVLSSLGASGENLQTQAVAQQTAIKAGGQAAADSAMAQAEISISEETAHRDIMNALGLDVRDPQSAIRVALDKKAQLTNERNATRSKITELQSVSFLQNPLQFIMNIPQLNALVPAHNQMVDEENDLTNDVTKLQGIAASAKALTPAKGADNLRQKAIADARMQVEAANEKLAVSRANASAGQAKILLDTLTVQRNVFHDALQLEGATANLEIRGMARMDAEAQRKAKEEAGRRGQMLATGINAYRTMLNGPTVTALSADEVNAMPGEMKGMWTEVLSRGSFGNSYGESIPFIERFGNMTAAAESGNATMMLLARNTKIQAEAMVGQMQEAHRKANPMAPQLKYGDALQMAYNSMFKQHSDLAAKGADKAGLATSTSPYQIDYDAALVTATTNGVKDNAVINALAEFKKGDPYAPLKGKVTDRQIVDAVNAQVVAGNLPPAKAAQQVAKFYTDMETNAYISGGLKYFGLPKMEDYSITLGAMGKEKTDLMNPTRVENYFTRNVARMKALQQMNMNTDAMGNNMFNLGMPQ